MFNRNTSFYRSTYEAIKHTYKLDTNGASRRRPPPPVLYRTVLYCTVLYIYSAPLATADYQQT